MNVYRILGRFALFLLLTIPFRVFAVPTIAPGIVAGEIGDGGAEWLPTVGVNLDVGSLSFRHLVSGKKRGAYKTYGSNSYASYFFPITSDQKTLRFRLGLGYMRKTVTVLDSEMRSNNESEQKYSTGYVFLNNGFSARTNFGSFYTSLDVDGFYYPNALLPFYRGYGIEFVAALAVGIEL